VVPLTATGQCILEYYAEERKRKENFPVKLWVNPPAGIYIQGDIAFDPRGIVVGSNADAFWLAIRLKEISTYWWGTWSGVTDSDNLLISPKIVLESLGLPAVESDTSGGGNWSLSKEEALDVLTRRNDKGDINKRVYVDKCDYLARKIEYFGVYGQAQVAVELQKYKEVVDGFFIPTSINISTWVERGRQDSIQITIKSVKSASFTEKQTNVLFARPEPHGFKHVFVNIDGKWIEQP